MRYELGPSVCLLLVVMGCGDPIAPRDATVERDAAPAPDASDAGTFDASDGAACPIARSASPIQPRGHAYVNDDFEDEARSGRIWNLTGTSCSSELHLVDGAYPSFGQTSRRGYCGFRAEDSDHFIRFITHPFDRRDAARSSFQGSVDWGKGGAETRARYGFDYEPSGAFEGWDLAGDGYLVPSNTVAYEFDFRLYNLSILQEELASSATIAQFHSRGGVGDRDCGLYYPGSSPSPALYVRLADDDPESVVFNVSLKIFAEDVPASLEDSIVSCFTQTPLPASEGGPERSLCLVEVWRQTFPIEEVFRRWFTARFVIRPSHSDGIFEFAMGSIEQDVSDPQYAFQTRTFNDGSTRLAPISMAHNDCPSELYLGNYVLGYRQNDYDATGRTALYGFYRADWVGLPGASKPEVVAQCRAGGCGPGPLCEWEKHRACRGALHYDHESAASTCEPEAMPADYLPHLDEVERARSWCSDSWVGSEILARYGHFIRGTHERGVEYPPQLITDYDDFRIVQRADWYECGCWSGGAFSDPSGQTHGQCCVQGGEQGTLQPTSADSDIVDCVTP